MGYKEIINANKKDGKDGEEIMATYTDKQSLLDSALGEFKELGFGLVEPNCYLLQLYFKDKLIATYIQAKLTTPVLREACRDFLGRLIVAWEAR